MNSLGLLVSCHSRIRRSQLIFASKSLEPACFPSLYRQWAATPYSEMWCISQVRIWISTGCPFVPMTVVWRDWYILGFGTAM